MTREEIVRRALRAAAATTGVLGRGALASVAVGALSLGCGSTPAQTSQAPAPTNAATTTDQPTPADAGVAFVDCEDDPGYGSACCTAQEALGMSPAACTPWGPPAPPAWPGAIATQALA